MKIMRTSPLNALLPSLLALCCTLSISVSSQAQEFRYITDVLYVPLRSGAGYEFRIINAALRTGTQLKFLEEDAEGKWAKVVTPNNVEGWIPTQYIMSERPAQMQLTEALAKIAELEQETAELQTRNQTLLNENQQLQGQSTDALTSRDSMSKELQRIRELSRNAIQLESTNQELVEKHQLIQTERDALFAENENLKSDQRTDFMLYGAGLVILGVILALLIPALIPKKGYSEWK